MLEVCEGTDDWLCKLSAINIGIDFDGMSVTVLDSLSNGGENTNQIGIDLWSFHMERRVINGERDRDSSRLILDGQSRDIGLKMISIKDAQSTV